MTIETRDDLLAAVLQLVHAARELKHMPLTAVDGLEIGMGRPVSVERALDSIAFDLRIAQVRIENHRKERGRQNWKGKAS